LTWQTHEVKILSGWCISSDHTITSPNWIASSFPGISSTVASWMLFLQLVRACSLQLYFAFLPCIWISVFSILIELKKTRQPTYIGNSQVNVLPIEKQLKIDIPFDVCTSKISWQKHVSENETM